MYPTFSSSVGLDPEQRAETRVGNPAGLALVQSFLIYCSMLCE